MDEMEQFRKLRETAWDVIGRLQYLAKKRLVCDIIDFDDTMTELTKLDAVLECMRVHGIPLRKLEV